MNARIRNAALAAGIAVAGVSLAPASRAAAAGTANATARPAYDSWLVQEAMRDAADGCKYAVRVHGDVTLLDPVRPGGTGTQIVPRDLTVDATVQCRDGTHAAVTRRLSSTEPIARSLAATRLAELAKLAVPRPGEQCMYVPVIAWPAEGLRLEDVRSSCSMRIAAR